MNEIQAHRGPDDKAVWTHTHAHVGLAHRRLSIIDLSPNGRQPLALGDDRLVANGEIYNYRELRTQLGKSAFRTESDSECILVGYRLKEDQVLDDLRGMYAFAVWDERRQRLFCARDRFGIKPFYYTVSDGVLYFASEAKALLPFVPEVRTNPESLSDYLTFQLVLEDKTLFAGIHELPPAHTLVVENGQVQIKKYWDVYYDLDTDHTDTYFQDVVHELLEDSVKLHLRADVPVGAYVSGGIDSSLLASMANRVTGSSSLMGFTGRFDEGAEFDESGYARDVARKSNFSLVERTIGVTDFIDNIEKVIYHLDFPVAGPGSFPQYMVSELAAKHRKVVIGGQGGDEIFGGYARYLVAYFEQCIKAAIEGRLDNGDFVVTYESIIPSLRSLESYKPMLSSFWSQGLFESMDKRYFQLIDRSPRSSPEVSLPAMDYAPFEAFLELFNARNVGVSSSYFDSMTHFDFKTLLPALLHVEDRMSMAHGLEARVPLLDHPLVELAASIPANVKFKDGQLKRLLKKVAAPYLPESVSRRQDKMGFPVPLTQWIQGEAHDFVMDVFTTGASRGREFIDNDQVRHLVEGEGQFSRKIWAYLSLELWQQAFHDEFPRLRRLIDAVPEQPTVE